jgi:hypothetical protein
MELQDQAIAEAILEAVLVLGVAAAVEGCRHCGRDDLAGDLVNAPPLNGLDIEYGIG